MLWTVLPSIILKLVSSFQKHQAQKAEGAEKTRRQTFAKALDVIVKDRVARSQERQTAMSFKVFWIPWLIAAVPWSLWFGLGMLDSAGLQLIEVHELPPQLKQISDAITVSLFGSGAVAGGFQAIARAIATRR